MKLNPKLMNWYFGNCSIVFCRIFFFHLSPLFNFSLNLFSNLKVLNFTFLIFWKCFPKLLFLFSRFQFSFKFRNNFFHFSISFLSSDFSSPPVFNFPTFSISVMLFDPPPPFFYPTFIFHVRNPFTYNALRACHFKPL